MEPSPTPTPKTAENNPLIMQIKKELGQIPADTVIQYQEDMIVKPKVKVEPTEEESDKTPQSTQTNEVDVDPPVVKQEIPDPVPEVQETTQTTDSQEDDTQIKVDVKVEVTEAS